MQQHVETKYIGNVAQPQKHYDYERIHSYVKLLHLLIGAKVTEQFTSCKDVRLCRVCKGFHNRAVMF